MSVHAVDWAKSKKSGPLPSSGLIYQNTGDYLKGEVTPEQIHRHHHKVRSKGKGAGKNLWDKIDFWIDRIH
jgi:hypothetical protein